MNSLILKSIFLLLFSVPCLAQVNPVDLSRETLERFELVPEFAFIQEQAELLGVKVYLFGGTASAFAHYVRWDLEREGGATKYQKERFDYDFTNIYRSNQDLDLVVDGTAEQAAALRQILQGKYPHFIGTKDAWEVRLLNAKVGDKVPLLNNPDFLNQHTDTNSTGMLALNPDEGDIVFRDLFSWDNPNSVFLEDVSNAEIKYLFNPNHETTTRFKRGQNPPIFSAVRYLAKLAQYEVKGTPDDFILIQRIIRNTDWANLSNYVEYKLKEFGLKVLLNAPNVEYAWNLLDSTGLRKKLIKMDHNKIDELDSLSWWMNKEPLRSKPVGTGVGRTAQEIFDEMGIPDLIVSHETNSFQAYDNITRSSQGLANAFISREKTTGEMAVLGKGFYTLIGLEGARGTNLTIRFKLNPEAREGTDFILDGNVIVVQNKNAMTLIQENLNLSIIDFLKLLVSGGLDNGDLGIKEKFMRKFGRINTDSKDFKDAVAFVEDSFFIDEDFPLKDDLHFIKTDGFNFSDLITVYLDIRTDFYTKKIIPLFKTHQRLFLENSKWVFDIIKKGNITDKIVKHVISEKHWAEHEQSFELISAIILNGNSLVYSEIAQNLFSKKHWGEHPRSFEIFQLFMENVRIHSYTDQGSILAELAQFSLSQEHWAKHDKAFEIIQMLLKEDQYNQTPTNNSNNNPRLLIGERGDVATLTYSIILYVLSTDHWAKHQRSLELVEMLIDEGDHLTHLEIIRNCLSKPYWENHDGFLNLLKLLLKHINKHTRNLIKPIPESSFEDGTWLKNKELESYLIGRDIDFKKIKRIYQKKAFMDIIGSIKKGFNPSNWISPVIQKLRCEELLK